MQGHQALAAFYDMVEQVDPELAAILHESNARKPFTLSQLNGLPAMRDGEVRLRDLEVQYALATFTITSRCKRALEHAIVWRRERDCRRQ